MTGRERKGGFKITGGKSRVRKGGEEEKERRREKKKRKGRGKRGS